MNVYFIDPTYIKPEAWEPLLTYLKAKVAFSFIPQENLHQSLLQVIRPYLQFSYSSNDDLKTVADQCAFWLREHFEKQIRLYPGNLDLNLMSEEDKKVYSTSFALKNLQYLNDDNCLILTKLKSSYNSGGCILPPICNVPVLQETNLPTHIAKYCWNILRKKHGHTKYEDQSSIVMFDEFFAKAFIFLPCREWNVFTFTGRRRDGTTIKVNFTNTINGNVAKLCPEHFPLIDDNGRKRLTPIRTQEGDLLYKKLLQDAEHARELAERYARDQSDDWSQEVEQMTRNYWNECGESGSNCDSSPVYG